jgi:hypothetical protein
MTDLPALLQRLQNLPVVAIQLRPGHSDYSKTLGRWQESRWLDAVLSVPGWTDSRYTRHPLKRLLDPDPAETDALAAALARALHAPLHTAHSDEDDWIVLQPPAPEIPWSIPWSATRWREDGLSDTHTGTETVHAASGSAASAHAGQRALARLSPDGHAQVRLQTALVLGTRTHPTHHEVSAALPAGAPAVERLRAQARGGALPSALLQGLPDATPLELMIVLSQAFSLSLAELAPVGAWRRQELSAAQMDPVIAARIQDHELRWGLGWLLRGVWRRAEPMRPAMLAYRDQGVGPLQMIVALREAFGLSLRHGKELVGMCCSLHFDDAAFEQRLRECVAESR